MTITIFMTLLAIFAVAVSLITEAVKSFLDSVEIRYSSNVVVLIVSIIVGVFGTYFTYIFLGIPLTLPNIMCIGLMALSVWVGSMVGYDKVLQMIEQMRGLK